jgi:hypothetical protein
MRTFLFSSIGMVLLLTLNSCFKDEPKREMRKAAGSWRIDHVAIQLYDSLGNESSGSEINEPVGILLLTHNDEFLYEGRFSYSYDGTALASSSMHSLFLASDVWGMGIGGKTFNLGNNDPSTGYTTHLAGFTVVKLRRNKMELQYVRVHADSGNLEYRETWTLVRATHY